MNEKSLRVLEYDKVKDLLAGFTITDPGREKAEAIAPLGSREEVVETLSEVTETMALLKEAGRPPVGGCQDLRPYLRQVRAEGAWLSPTALLEVLSSVEAARDCRRHFSGHDRAPRLAALSGRLNPLK
ncbi:hypothetical protein [Desulfuromonas sp.]|nr:hypothetical protein [Desulfuromonas sp.]